jgi:hypothetical protein
MRSLLFTFCATIAVFSPSSGLAQIPVAIDPPPAAAQSDNALAAPSAASIAAARSILRSFLVSTHELGGVWCAGFQRGLSDSKSGPGGLTEPQRQAITLFLEHCAAIAEAEIERSSPQIIDDLAPRLGVIVPESDLVPIADFLSSTDGVQVLAHTIRRETNPSDTLPEAQSSAYAAFRATSGGRVFVAHASAMGAVILEASERVTTAIRIPMIGHVCEAMGDQCPEGMRPANTR